MQALAKFIYYRLLGWELLGRFPKIDKCVVIVAPHTSWVDFFLGLLIRKVLSEEIHYIGKQSLFKPPFGWFFRWMGGTPIDRSKSNDTVGETARVFGQKDKFRLALSPEGTRKKVVQWKTGFYYIAQQAHVPIVMVAFDFGKKQIKISEPVFTSGSIQQDFVIFDDFYKGVKGKKPEYGF